MVSSTCDLVPDRRKYALLARVFPVTPQTPQAKNIIGTLLKFHSSKEMYLPPLEVDRQQKQIIANVVQWDGLALILNTDLALATRHASMSLVGWRIFASLVKNLVARTGESEIKLRTCFDKQG